MSIKETQDRLMEIALSRNFSLKEKGWNYLGFSYDEEEKSYIVLYCRQVQDEIFKGKPILVIDSTHITKKQVKRWWR
jgi:hypothetical protein